MMTDMPKVSVCIPTYNRANFLKIAIESVLMQNFDDYEVIITDNSDNNETKEMVEKLNHPKIRYYKNEKNLGMVGNWNRCLEYANGEYIKFLMDDDTFEQGILKIQSGILDKYPNVGLVYCYYKVIDSKGNLIGPNKWGLDETSYKLSEKDYIEEGICFIKNYLLGKRVVGLPTAMMFRKIIIDEIGLFDENSGYAIDAEMWCRIATIYDFYYNSQHLCNLRWHSSSISLNFTAKDLLNHRQLYYFINKVFKEYTYKTKEDFNEILKIKRKVYLRVTKMAIGNFLRSSNKKIILNDIFSNDKFFINKIYLIFYLIYFPIIHFGREIKEIFCNHKN